MDNKYVNYNLKYKSVVDFTMMQSLRYASWMSNN